MWCAVAASGIRKVADASDRTDVCGCTCTYTSILYSCDVSSLFPVDEDEDELNLASWLSFGRQIILFSFSFWVSIYSPLVRAPVDSYWEMFLSAFGKLMISDMVLDTNIL